MVERCPPDCPRRSISPNCHNVETCVIWAKHTEDQKRREILKRKESDKYYFSRSFAQYIQRKSREH